jgi:hypothetical protein
MASMKRSAIGVIRTGLATLGILALTWPAAAQFRPPGASAPAVGERYNIEAALIFWNAEPDVIVSSESLGIPGDDIDLQEDLGIEQKRLREFRLVLRPATKHKFRFNYLPISYDAEAVVQREFVFNGQRYRLGLPVNTEADLTTYRFGYEYDFFYRSRGYIGVLLDLKYTDVEVVLDSPIGREFTTAVAPIPGIGVVGRGYLASNVSITGEVSYFRIPENLGQEDFGGRYLEYDFYATFNFNRNAGAQLGVRGIDVDYFEDFDRGFLTFKGWYFGGVLRY